MNSITKKAAQSKSDMLDLEVQRMDAEIIAAGDVAVGDEIILLAEDGEYIEAEVKRVKALADGRVLIGMGFCRMRVSTETAVVVAA